MQRIKTELVVLGGGPGGYSAVFRAADLGKQVVLVERYENIGTGIVGPNAGELIAELALAIEENCTADEIAATVHPHPTLSETIMMAAEVFEGTVTDLYLPKE